MPTPDARFRPHERLNDPADFRRAFDRRRSVSDARLVVYAVENGLEFSRLGISISRKKVRKATARNQVQARLLRESFRLGKGEIPTGLDLVIVPRHGDLSFSQDTSSPSRASPATPPTPPRPPREGLSRMRAWLSWPGRLIVALIVALIRVYQRAQSPFLGPPSSCLPVPPRELQPLHGRHAPCTSTELVRGLAEGDLAGPAMPPLEPGRV